MAERELVSVVIPTYKRPKKLERALKSVINQTYENLEIIVVNDAPETDLNHITGLDDRVKLINHKENKGAPAARNTGIKDSKGEYIAFLDDDDEWLPKKIEEQTSKFDELSPSYGAVYPWARIVKDDSHITEKTPSYKGDIHDELLRKNFIPSVTPLVRKNCFKKVGLFDEKLKCSQDYDMWLRISKEYKFSYVPKILVRTYRGHEKRISSDISRKIEGTERLVNKHKKELERFPINLHKRYKQLGVNTALNGYERSTCAEYFKKSFHYNKKDINSLIYYLICNLPKKVRKSFFGFVKDYYSSQFYSK